MRKIYIKTTESCNLHCKHCYINDFRKQTRFFDWEKTANWVQKYINLFKLKNEEILFSFHGGEPFLCDLDILQKFIDRFPGANFNATSNLCFPIYTDFYDFVKKNFIDPVTKIPYIKTSWDYKIRFRNAEQEGLWTSNVVNLAGEMDVHVTTCLTKDLIKDVIPYSYLEEMQNLGVSSLNFERLTENTTMDKSLIPDYEEQDKWLFEMFLDNETSFGFPIEIFDNLKRAAAGEGFSGCRKRNCMQEVLTINADGTIGGCPNTALLEPFSSIDKDPVDLIKNQCQICLIDKEQIRNNKCYTCPYYKICNGDCHQLSWQGDICPAPKKVIEAMLKEIL